MSGSPIEGIIRCRHIEELVVLLVVTLVIAERRKECRLAQQFTLDVEEDGPLRRICAIGHQVAGMQDKIRRRIFDDSPDHLAVHVVPGAGVTIDYELKCSWTLGRGFERAFAFIAS